MTSLANKFVDGLFWKTVVIGLVAALIGWWTMSLHFAGAILLGVLVSAFNLRVVGWVSRGMAKAASQGDTGTTLWTILWVFKLTALFVLTFVFVIVIGANVLGYIIGYSTFLLAIVWQLGMHLIRQDDSDDASSVMQDGDTESL